MEKLDLTKRYKTYYSAKQRPEIVEIEPATFLPTAGKGDPSQGEFAEDVSALYSTAYAIKFACKSLKKDFTVAKLEGLWWFDEVKFGTQSMAEASTKIPRSEWQYRLLIRVPDYVTAGTMADAIKSVVSKRQFSRAEKIERYEMREGKCVQMLHIGSLQRKL